MKLSHISHSALLVSLIATSTLMGEREANAESIVINGGTCVPYPNFGSSNTGGVPYQHWLYGFRQSAYCHFDLHDDTRASNLWYAVVNGSASTVGPVRLRLCTYRVGSLSVSCGTESTLSGNASVALLYPPSGASSPYGAFVHVRFPNGGVSTIRNIVAAFRPSSSATRLRVASKSATPEAAVAQMKSQVTADKKMITSAFKTVEKQNRKDGWAKPREAKLKKSFKNAKRLRGAKLSKVNCRTTGCILSVKLGKRGNAKKLVEQRQAVTDWIAWNQPCAYSVRTDGKLGKVDIVTRCGKKK